MTLMQRVAPRVFADYTLGLVVVLAHLVLISLRGEEAARAFAVGDERRR